MPASSSSLRVCYFGTYRAGYSRNRILIQGLRANGVEVIECQEALWQGIEDRVQTVSGGWRRPAFWWRVARTYARLLARHRRVGDYDVLVVGYPGHLDVFLARVLSWWRRRPLVWDVFMSIYLIALERRLDRASRLGVALLRGLEKLATRLPERLVIDTEEYVRWFEQVHGVPAERFALVPTGADDTVFRPLPGLSEPPGPPFRVLYYGSFIPNHGVPTIVEAARYLASRRDIQLELVGDGPERPGAEAMVRRTRLENVRFTDWLAPQALRKRIARSHICLGAFGATPQSLMTVQNKIYECLAMARPVITGDGPAVRRAFRHGEHLWLVPRGNPAALAEAIERLCDMPDLRRRLGMGGYQQVCVQYTVHALGMQFWTTLVEVVKGGPRAAQTGC